MVKLYIQNVKSSKILIKHIYLVEKKNNGLSINIVIYIKALYSTKHYLGI